MQLSLIKKSYKQFILNFFMEISDKTALEIDEGAKEENLKQIEAIFFVSGRFLTMPELVSLSELNPVLIKDLIEELKEKYENYNSAIEIIEKNEMWKMDVKNEYSYIINKLATGKSEFTKAEQETLAIIAFKQPIKQSVVIKIRGNKAYDHVKKFSDLGLIKKKKTGHTNELSLSDDFYDYFGVVEGEEEVEENKINEDSLENKGQEEKGKIKDG